MALVTSKALKGREDTNMNDQKIAKEDIVEANDAGQQVVLVPAGQPVPDDDEMARRRLAAGVTRNATDDEIAAARAGEPVDQPGAQPASSSSRRSARK